MPGVRAAALLWSVAVMGCAGPLPWPAETVYVVEDLDTETQDQLEGALRRELVGDGLEFVGRDPDGGRLEFRLSRPGDARTMRRVQSVIEGVGHSARVPVVLREASLRFGSVQGRGRAEIRVSGSATPGATVWLEVGQRVIQADVSGGQWSASVVRTPQLRERHGWMYAMIEKGSARQYLRLNVLDTDSSEVIERHELPSDCLLRAH